MPIFESKSGGSGPKRPLPSFLGAGRAVLFSRLLLLISGVANSLMLPLVLDQRQVGLFFISQIYIAGVTIAALMGLTLTMPAKLTAAAARGDFSTARRIASVGVGIAGGASLILSLLTFLLGQLAQAAAPPTESAEVVAIVWILAATIPFATASTLTAEMLRSLHIYRWASNLSLLSGLSPVAYLVLCLASARHVSLPEVLLAVLAGFILGAGIGGWRLAQHFRGWGGGSTSPGWLELTKATLPNFATTLVLFVLSQSDIVLLSLWMPPEAVAHYGIALRLSSLLLLPLSIANSAFAPIAVELRETRQDAQLQNTASLIAAIAFGLAALGYFGFSIVGLWLIELWNPAYSGAYWLFLILGAGQVMHVWFGTSGVLLMILGHQVEAMWVTIVLGAAATVLCVLGLVVGGSQGLAIASAIGNAGQALVFWQRVKKRLSINSALRLRRA